MPSPRRIAGLLLLLAVGPAVAADFQHVLIVIADDLGSDKVGAYAADVDNPEESRPATPTLDLLADAGVRFSDAWATPACSSTRAQLFSGEYPHRNGVGSVIPEGSGIRLPTSPTTLQQFAADAGLATGHFGKWHVGETAGTPDAPTATQNRKEYPIATGFSVYAGNTDGTPEGYLDWLYITSLPDAAMSSGYATTAVQSTDSLTDTTTDDAVAWMEEQSALGNRMLTVVSYNLPHYTIDSAGELTWEDAVVACGGTPSGDDTADAHFAVTCLDDAVADLLDRAPELEDTLVIFIGDNGTPERLAEGHFADGRCKFTVYESGVRVPMLVADGAAVREVLDTGAVTSATTLDAGGVVSDPSSMVDVYATVADLLDLAPGSCTPGSDCARDSQSLRSVLTGGAATRTHAWVERINHLSGGTVVGGAAVRIGDVKLLVQTDTADPACRSYELYDLSVDRWEQDDRFDDPDYADIQAELLAVVEEKAALMSGTRLDWLGVDDCEVCADEETWYDGLDQACDGGSDYDQDGDGVDALAWGGTDCDDTDPGITPAAIETWYDGVDQDCAGDDDYDQDGDGHPLEVDCDDTDARVYPGAVDAWYDGVDADCAGDDDYDGDRDGWTLGYDCDDMDVTVYPGAPEVWYDGVDQDCAGDDDFDQDGDGADLAGDCDDLDAAVSPHAVEVWYDGVDQDCDGNDDDQDGDGMAAIVAGGADCDDTDPYVRPGVLEVWYDGVDQDCDGNDADQDGDGEAAIVAGGADCDDTDARVRPDAPERWYDGVDQNCDGRSDHDRDGDGHDAARSGGTDCHDGDPRRYPGAREIWYDGRDQDCAGDDDYDRDGDGYRSHAHGGDDCNDARADVHPGAVEIPGDGIDQNCLPLDAS